MSESVFCRDFTCRHLDSGDSCKLVDFLIDEVNKLRRENAKLREDNDRLIQAIEDLHDVRLEDKLVQLENENDKLRELIKAAWRCTNTVPSCLECRIVAGGCTLLMAMRELGVEVE